jgi:ubiquinone/menaquinone biosynthesis C-methylase UbiE
MAVRTAAEVAECFRACYSVPKTDAHRRLEELVFGSDFGADGWTTLGQADQLGRRLQLGPGQRLLDIGTGRGWPGLYLAGRSGCAAVLTDQPLDGLRQAAERTRRDGLADRVQTVASTALALPFRTGSFDAVVHADVLCCLRPKRLVLKECRRVLRRGGLVAFFVIHLADGITADDRRYAVEVGPPAVDMRSRDYLTLLRSAGFGDAEQVDVTAAYLATLHAWLTHARAMADSLARTEPPGVFAQCVEDRTATSAAADRGLLRRSLFVARR